ncbi:MAG: hypothetical protein IJC19_07905 [Clostridia bacterium]|nr:hypothetical protein [Clostridia bacterium]
MKKVVSVFLVLLLSLGIFAACGGSEALTKETLVGTWEGDCSMQEVFGDLKVDIEIEFKDDDTLTLTMDTDSVKEVLESLYNDEEFLQENLNMTKEQFDAMLSESNLTMDQMVQTALSAIDIVTEYDYSFEGGKLSIDDENAPYTYENGTLTITYQGEEMKLTRK